jgi:pilus assembly protein FimV
MMIALVDKNANAFIKNNINGLKRGYTLAVPSLSEVTQLTRQQAAAAVKQQNMAWKNRNVANKVAASTISTQAVEQVTQAEPVNQPEQALPSTEVESRNGEPTARLQLLGSNDEKLLSENDLAAFGNEQVKALSDQLTVAQEVIESQQQENIDIKARMAAMEEQIQTLRKLISLQDPDLARLQSKLEQESVEQAASTLEEMAAVLNDSVSNIDELPSEEAELDAADASLALNTDEAVVEGENGPETVLQETMAETASIASEQSNVSSLAVNPSESNQEPITDAPSATLLEKVQALLVEHKMKALLAGLAFLLGLLLLNRRKAEDARTTWDEAIEKLDGNKASKPVSAVAAVAPVDKDIAVEPESDFDTVKTVDDLIKDADIYVSYGDFDKAGQVLAEAYDDEPTNLLVIQKLLFTHYKQAKTSAFVELARQYTVDRDSMEWAEVAEWGRELDPENVLFEEASIEAEANDEIVALAPSLAFDVSSESEQDNSRLELGQEEKEDTTQATEDEALLAFTSYVDVDETEVSDMAEESESDTSLDSTIPELDLTLSDDNDFEIDGLDAMTEGDLEAATLAMSDNSADDDLAFDLGDFDAVDEAETKLDLASAYIEMGDPEGAKSILQEVMSEGDDDQKSRAKTLLNDL